MTTFVETVQQAIATAKPGQTFSGREIAKRSGIAHRDVLAAIEILAEGGHVTTCNVVRGGEPDIDVRPALSIRHTAFNAPLVIAPHIAPCAATTQPTPPNHTTTEPAMPNKKIQTNITAVLRDTLNAVADLIDAGDIVTGATVAESLGINTPAAHKRMDALATLKLLHNAGASRRPDWLITDAGRAALSQEASNSADAEEKAPETARQSKSFAERIKASNDALVTSLKANASGFANTVQALDAAMDEPAHQIRTAITDAGEVMLFDGPPDTTTPTVIPPYMARRLVALFRTLPSEHALSLES